MHKLIGLILITIFLFGCTEYNLKVQYHFTAEGTYQDIELDNTQLKYSYFEDKENKCAQWIAQAPCWTEQDLKTKQAEISGEDLRETGYLIEDLNFFDLLDSYGASENQRYYTHSLDVNLNDKIKQIDYRSAPNAEEMPEEFKKVKERLEELVAKYIK